MTDQKLSSLPAITPSDTTLFYGVNQPNVAQGSVTGAALKTYIGTSGSGNVVGPASSTDNAITRYDGTTGLLIQNSLATVDDSGVIGSNGANLSGALNLATTTSSRALVTDASKNVISSVTTAAELGFVSGVTSSIQTQINSKGSGTVTGTGTATQVAFWNSTSALSGNANLYWDNTNSRLGLGTSAPALALDIAFNSNTFDGFRVTQANAGTSAQIQNRLVNDTGAICYTGITSSAYNLYAPINGGRSFFGSYMSDFVVFTQSTNDIIFYPNSVEKMRISSAGTVTMNSLSAGGLVKAAATTGALSIAVANTDYQSPITLTTTGTSGAATLTGSTLNIPQYTGGGGGGVSSVSVVSANGFGGTVATATTTPAITITTSITGLLKGNGTAVSSAFPGVDYLQPFGSQTANTFYAAPNGSSGLPSFRAIVAADIPTLNQNTTGSAATLTTPRAINGVNFDGSAAITVTAAAGTLTGSTLAAGVTNSSLTSLGTQSVAINMGSQQINNLANPSLGTDAVNLTTLQSFTSGLSGRASCRLATTAALIGTYANGVSGVGATFTYTATGVQSVDGVTPVLGDRTLLKNQTLTFQNGIYTWTTLGAIGVAGILTRATDFDQAANNEVVEGSYAIIEEGTANAGTMWIETGQGPFTIGTTAILFTELLVAPQNITLSGDISGSGAGSVSTTLATVNSNVGSFGSATAIPIFTVNAKGLITAASTAAVVFPANTTATASNFFTAYNSATGAFTKAQPAFTDVSGTATPSQGGTGISSYTLGDTLYSSATNTLAKLAGNTTSAKQFLTQTGTGTVSAAPIWGALASADIPNNAANTTGSAATLTTARTLAGNSFNGSANVPFTNKFIVQGTTDAGLTGAQFLGALGTGIVKNTTTTGVLSIAVAADFPTLNQNTTGSAATLTTPRAIGIGGTTGLTATGVNFDGSATINPALTGTLAVANGGTGVTASDPILQHVYNQIGTIASGTTAFAASTSIPVNSNGDQYLSQTITPKSATSILIIEVKINLSSSATGINPIMCCALFQDATVNALDAEAQNLPANAGLVTLHIRYTMVSGTTSATTFKVRAGGPNNTTYMNGNGTAFFGGTWFSSIRITEQVA